MDRDEKLDLSPGRVLGGRYEIRRRIGVGGAGAVFVAFDSERSAEVAVKVFAPRSFRDDLAKDRLFREADAAGQLDHPGIAEVLEAGSDGELHFIIQELLEGFSLRQKLNALAAAGQRLSISEVVHIGASLCSALDYAHKHGIHGRIKPEDVFLCEEGEVKLTDFGITRILQTARSATADISAAAAPYMAPEQLRGLRAIDHRVDQYATAAVLYEMLVGEPPVGRVKSAKEKRPDTPLVLSQAIDRALEINPADRFSDMAAFAAALSGRRAFRPHRLAIWVAASAAVLVVVAGLTFPRWRGPVESLIRGVASDPQGRAAAETARRQAVSCASRWQAFVETLPAGQLPEHVERVNGALLAGDTHFEAMEYGKAEEAYRRACEVYQSQLTAATQELHDKPVQVSSDARNLLESLNALERQFYVRVADAASQLDDCERNLRNACTSEEREACEELRRRAETELELMNRLKSLVQEHAFSPSLRAEIRNRLNQADGGLEAGRSQQALLVYMEAKTRLDELRAFPDQAERALRQQAALTREMEQLRSALGPEAMELVGVQAALDDGGEKIALGDQELGSGRVLKATAFYESAREQVYNVMGQAVEGLLSRARSYDGEGKPVAAVAALEELLALDPDHVEGQQLREGILSRRIVNSIEMELVFIPPGTFIMGSPQSEPGHEEDERRRSVKIESGFYMGTTEATQSQWRAVMGNNPSEWEGDDRPVEQVSWEEVQEFCRRLSLSEGRSYRLPTEAEWEYACRAGTTTPFYFGETISTDQANYDGEYVYGEAPKGAFRNETTPVASFPANAWGLYDMHGNVWEWCPDGIEDYPPSPVRRAPEAELIEGRVLRGGSWRSRLRYCRCANRVRDIEDSRLSNVGFRVVLESD